MLIDFLFRFFVTFAGTAIGDAPAPAPAPTVQIEKIETERVAQVRLAEVLGTADGIHSVSSRGKQITFVITRGEEAFRVVADTRKGEVIALTVAPMSSRGQELGGGLSWLADELAAIPAVTRLVADEDGAVTITTSDHRRYMAIPGRGSGGNAGVEARWAAEWNQG
jgi:hypothetical protein